MVDEANLPFSYGERLATPTGAKPKRHPHVYDQTVGVGNDGLRYACRCGVIQDPAAGRRNKNNRKRGNAAELDVARALGGRKMGPLGLPWDVEMEGYARLQVRKYATPQGLRTIALELARIGSGATMPGYVWIEPGRGGEALIVFRLADFAERHGK